MRIGQVAARAGVSTDAVRFYEARGLVRSVRRANGYRDFDAEAVDLIVLIRAAQELGFSLSEIGELLGGLREEGLSRDQVRAHLEAKIADIDARMAKMAQLREALEMRLQQACPLMQRARA